MNTIDLDSFLMPILFAPSAPWVAHHLFRMQRLHSWRPQLKEPVGVDKIRVWQGKGWQRIQCGTVPDLPLIQKEPSLRRAKLEIEKDRFCCGSFSFRLYRIKGGIAVEFPLKKDEHLFGLGERFYSFDLRGESQMLWTTDALLSNSTKRMYKPVPFFLSTGGYGIFLNTAAPVYVEAKGKCLIAVKGSLDLWRFQGSPRAVLSAYTELTGKPPVVPKWSFGLWVSRCMYPNRKTVEEVAWKLRNLKIPADLLSLDPFWIKGRERFLRDAVGFEWNEKRFPHPEEMIKKLCQNHFRLCLWINPYIPLQTDLFREAEAKGYLVQKGGKAAWTIDGPAALLDFTHPKAFRWYQKKLQKLLQQGVATFKTDYGEAAPPQATYKRYRMVAHHNLYPLLYNKASFEAVKEAQGKGLVWARSAWAGSQRYPTHWSGDTKCTWHDLRHALIGGLNLALSGFAYWSVDIGGFVGTPSEELFIRWAELGLFLPHARLHGTTPREPWVFGQRAMKIFRKYASLRYRLIPYLYSYAHVAYRKGYPLLRPMLFEFPEDAQTYALDRQFMLGSNLLVAPVLQRGARTKEVYFPKGEWISLEGHNLYYGRAWETVPAPLSRVPLFLRRDSILPLGPPVQYVDEKREPLSLLIFKPAKSSFLLYEEGKQRRRFISRGKGDDLLLEVSGRPGSYNAFFFQTEAEACEGEAAKIERISHKGAFLVVRFSTSQATARLYLRNVEQKELRSQGGVI